MSESQKPPIIEALFEKRWDPAAATVADPLVTLNDVGEAIRAYNDSHPDRPLSTRNPANFFKDFIRNKRSANANWPARIWERGYTARQVTGENRCFEFVPVQPGQTEAFPLNRVPVPSANTPKHRLESASMPLASRLLGRSDEAWLTQVAVRLRLVETHLALFSARNVIQVDHLQMSVKGSPAEIDSLYLVHEEIDGTSQTAIVTLEAKGIRHPRGPGDGAGAHRLSDARDRAGHRHPDGGEVPKPMESQRCTSWSSRQWSVAPLGN